jgi:hypothetical protein
MVDGVVTDRYVTAQDELLAITGGIMAIRTGEPAPYGPPQGVLTVINGFRDRGLATPFTGDVLLRAGISESLVPRVIKSLEALDLIGDDGMPTAEMEGLRRATTAEFQGRLADVVRAAYAEVFQFTDPATDDATRIADAFRSYNPPGQRGRMVTLFMGLCEAAGIIPASGGKAPAQPAPRQRSTMGKRTFDPRKVQAFKSRPPSDHNDHNAGVPAAITGLLKSLPPEGGSWPSARRTAFVKTFESVLDFCYPIADPSTDSGETDE